MCIFVAMNEKFIKCSCSSEYVRLSYDEDYKWVDLSIWECQSSHQATWRDKMRWIWHILTKGSPYGDQVILREQEIADMVDYLIETQNKKHE